MGAWAGIAAGDAEGPLWVEARMTKMRRELPRRSQRRSST
jgi:hypothetical protein